MDGTQGTTTASAVTIATAAAPEGLLQHIEDFFTGTEKKTVVEIEDLAGKFDADVWPYVKTLITTLASQTGQIALKAAIAAAPLLATGGFAAAGAEVGTAVVASLSVDTVQDVTTTLGQVQAALQAVKVTNAVVTAGDAPTMAVIQSATPGSAATGSTTTS